MVLLTDDMGVKECLTSLAAEITDLASCIPDSSGQLENVQRLDFCQLVSTYSKSVLVLIREVSRNKMHGC